MVQPAIKRDPITNMIARIRSALDWLIPVPTNASPQERRTYYMAGIGMPVGLITHLFLIFLFAYWGVPEMALFNVFSVFLWSLSIIFVRRRNPSLGFITFTSEVIAHTALAIYFVGWGMGIQYFLILLILVLTLSMWSLTVRLAVSLFCTALFILTYTYTLVYPPQVIVNPLQLYIVNTLNISIAFLSMISTALYGVGTADRLEAQLELEHQKSEALLNNILPESISVRLKNREGTIADLCEGTSILFADVVDFTPLSAEMAPAELVELLNEVFSDFDVLSEKYGLEKIKTIGDCYMVASGVPQPRADHAQALAQMALDMQAQVNSRAYKGRKLAFRIGINSGPVVAGVIGQKKFAYDLWGDTVNTASRMESNGQEGCIQITKATYELIKDDFVCDPRGKITVKGKGKMEIWFVLQENKYQALAKT
jgi:adenylate cyclase